MTIPPVLLSGAEPMKAAACTPNPDRRLNRTMTTPIARSNAEHSERAFAQLGRRGEPRVNDDD